MIAYLRSHRCRLPLAVILLLVTQIAFAGQACRLVMPAANAAGEVNARHQMHSADAGALVVGVGALSCCEAHPVPLRTCLVPDDASIGAALVAGGTTLPDIAPPADIVASFNTLQGVDVAPSPPADSAAGPPLRVYILFHRFLS